jgi:Zn-dependent protease
MTLSFRIGAIPVRVHLWFLFAALLLGLGSHRGPLGVVVWASGFVVTILAHELAHAAVARAFGAPAEVNLTLFQVEHSFRLRALSAARRVVVCLAGPSANLFVATSTLILVHLHPPAGETGANALRYLGFSNLGWGLFNLLPILPLDGGHAMVALLDGPTRGRDEQAVRWLSVACAVALGLVAVHSGMTLPALLCGLVAFQNVRASPPIQGNNCDAILRVHLQAAFDANERGETDTAMRHCRTVLGAPASPALQKDAVRLLAYAYASTGAWGRLMDLLESGGVLALERGELEKYELVACELGRSEEARRIALLRNRCARRLGDPWLDGEKRMRSTKGERILAGRSNMASKTAKKL